MLFKQFSETLSLLEKTDSRLKMTEVLAGLFRETPAEEIDKVCYLLQGRVVPLYVKLDFGLAERLVFKAFVSAFSLNGKEARRRFHELGDLGLAAEEYRRVTRTLFQTDREPTVIEVYNRLYQLAKLEGGGSQEAKLHQVADLLQELDPLSNRFLVRILVGNLRLGFSEMTVLDAFSWMTAGDKSLRAEIEKAYNVRPDLGFIGRTLKAKGLGGLKGVKPEVGVPILMAKAERVAVPGDILEKTAGEAAVEPKFDGFRLQLHLLPDKTVRIYSRNLDDVSYMYPDIVAALVAEAGAGELIIEGEAVGYNPGTGEFLPFQETVQRKRKYNIAEVSREVPLKLYAFDLLYLEGRSFINEPYLKRRETLKKIIKGTNGVITVAPERVVREPAELEALFTEYVSEGLEGIMAKKLTGRYEAGARGWNWIKFKHSYAARVTDTLDCLVMGYDYGKGKRTKFGLGAFLVGVRDEKNDRFVTIAKIGTGLTDEEWRSLKDSAHRHEVKEKPAAYEVNKLMAADVWLEPGIVVEIRADQITKSPAHTAGLALRFPRLERFRTDKRPTDVTSLPELDRIFRSQRNHSV